MHNIKPLDSVGVAQFQCFAHKNELTFSFTITCLSVLIVGQSAQSD